MFSVTPDSDFPLTEEVMPDLPALACARRASRYQVSPAALNALVSNVAAPQGCASYFFPNVVNDLPGLFLGLLEASPGAIFSKVHLAQGDRHLPGLQVAFNRDSHFGPPSWAVAATTLSLSQEEEGRFHCLFSTYGYIGPKLLSL